MSDDDVKRVTELMLGSHAIDGLPLFRQLMSGGYSDYEEFELAPPKTPLLQFVEEIFLERQGHATTYAFPDFDIEQATELREIRRPRGDPLLPARL